MDWLPHRASSRLSVRILTVFATKSFAHWFLRAFCQSRIEMSDHQESMTEFSLLTGLGGYDNFLATSIDSPVAVPYTDTNPDTDSSASDYCP